MGKADKNKKYSKFLSNNTKNSTAKTGGNIANTSKAHQSSSKYQSLVSDLNSLLEDKRFRACTMIGDIIASQESINSTSNNVLETYASSDVLNKLNLRCVDSSERVRIAAITALRNISCMGYENINGMIVKMGLPVSLVRSTCALLHQGANVTHANTSIDSLIRQNFQDPITQCILCKAHVIEQVVGIICNISACTDTKLDQNIFESIIEVLFHIISMEVVPLSTTGVSLESLNSLNDTVSKLKTGSWKCLLVLTDDDLLFNQVLLGTLGKENANIQKLNLLFINYLNDYSATSREMSVLASEALFHQSMCIGVVTNVITTASTSNQIPEYLCEGWCGLINKHNTSGKQIPPIELLYQINHICHFIITQCVVTHQIKAVECWKAYEVDQQRMQKQLDVQSTEKDTPMDETDGDGDDDADEQSMNEVPDSSLPMASVCPFETIYENFSSVLKTCLEILSNLVVSPLLQQHALININQDGKLGSEPVYMIDIGCNNIVTIIDCYNAYMNDFIQPLLFADGESDLSINVILYVLSDIYSNYDRIIPYIGNILNDIDAVISNGNKSTKSILIKLKVNEKMMLLLSRVLQLYIFSGDSINEIYSFLLSSSPAASVVTGTSIVSRIISYGSNKNEKSSVDFTSFLNSMKSIYSSSSNVIGSGVHCVVNYAEINSKDKSVFALLQGLLEPFVKSIIATVHTMPLNWSDILHSDVNIICAFASIPSQTNPDGSIFSVGQSLVLTNMLLRKIDTIQAKSAPPAGVLGKPVELVNFKEHTVLNYATCINGIIDIHSVDDVQLLNGYKKYSIHEKLTAAMATLQHEYDYLDGLRKTNGVKETMFDSELIEFIEGVLINGIEFLKYKQSYI